MLINKIQILFISIIDLCNKNSGFITAIGLIITLYSIKKLNKSILYKRRVEILDYIEDIKEMVEKGKIFAEYSNLECLECYDLLYDYAVKKDINEIESNDRREILLKLEKIRKITRDSKVIFKKYFIIYKILKLCLDYYELTKQRKQCFIMNYDKSKIKIIEENIDKIRDEIKKCIEEYKQKENKVYKYLI